MEARPLVLNSPNGIDFNDRTLRVRLNPDTYLKFEDGENVTIQNMFSDKSIRIKYDIMLILYPMKHWITVADLCEGWPPEDQIKIIEHLDMLYKSKIVVTERDDATPSKKQKDNANAGEGVVINVENHHAMLRDSIRMACYQRAIERAVTPDSVVLDLGCGSGILSFFAARAGAKKVYAIERRPDVIQLARELARANGFEDRIEFIENSSNLVQPEELDPRPDVFVSEIIGDAILEENILELTIDARDRLMVPGATLVPCQLDIMLVAFDSGMVQDRGQEVDELSDIYGLNFDILKAILTQKPTQKLDRFNPMVYTMMSQPVCVTELDLRTIQIPAFNKQFEIEMTQDGFVNGYCAYFKAHMNDETVLTNSPWAPPTHWRHVIYPFPTRRPVKAGDKLSLEMSYSNNSMGLWYSDDYQ